VVPACLTVVAGYGLYQRDSRRTDYSTADELGTIAGAVTSAAFVVLAAAAALSWSTPDRTWLLTFWGTAFAFVVLGRALARTVLRRFGFQSERAVILGTGAVGQLVAAKLARHPEYGIELAGFVDERPGDARADLSGRRLLGPPDALRHIVEQLCIERVIVACSNDHDERVLALVRSLESLPVRVDIVPRLFELVGPAAALDAVECLPVMSLGPTHSRVAVAAKRGLDVVVATVALVLTAPWFAFAAWRIRSESPGPAFFRQVRLGKDMREITVLKFRTMTADVDVEAHRAYIEATMSSSVAPEEGGLYKLDQSAVVTPFGRWLRKTSLDELPQLINVLRGEMSLVGPRPCLAYETRTFAPHHCARFLVRPGMTGLWQVTARARSTFGEALDMDVAYAANWSLGLDLKLLIRTPLQLIRLKSTV
jgi:exopolysaccharide biosynthesis polyprenyl glycosylphosphotransferase